MMATTSRVYNRYFMIFLQGPRDPRLHIITTNHLYKSGFFLHFQHGNQTRARRRWVVHIPEKFPVAFVNEVTNLLNCTFLWENEHGKLQSLCNEMFGLEICLSIYIKTCLSWNNCIPKHMSLTIFGIWKNSLFPRKWLSEHQSARWKRSHGWWSENARMSIFVHCT